MQLLRSASFLLASVLSAGTLAFHVPSQPSIEGVHRLANDESRAVAEPAQGTSSELDLCCTRKQWLAGAFGAVSASLLIPQRSWADGAEDTAVGKPVSPVYSVTKCDVSSKAPCVSTANVKNLEFYLPPWTYEVGAPEAMTKLKSAVLAADTTMEIVEEEGSRYLKARAKRNDLFQTVDELEFVVNDADKVVTFRASTVNSDRSDFGLNKKRLTEIRKKAGVFGIMGSGLNSADSVSQSARGNGPLGQLKAFYGLQSGSGFEDVVLDLDD